MVIGNLIGNLIFVAPDLSTQWVLQAPLCDSRITHIDGAHQRQPKGLVHTMRNQKLRTRNMEGFQFLDSAHDLVSAVWWKLNMIRRDVQFKHDTTKYD